MFFRSGSAFGYQGTTHTPEITTTEGKYNIFFSEIHGAIVADSVSIAKEKE